MHFFFIIKAILPMQTKHDKFIQTLATEAISTLKTEQTNTLIQSKCLTVLNQLVKNPQLDDIELFLKCYELLIELKNLPQDSFFRAVTNNVLALFLYQAGDCILQHCLWMSNALIFNEKTVNNYSELADKQVVWEKNDKLTQRLRMLDQSLHEFAEYIESITGNYASIHSRYAHLPTKMSIKEIIFYKFVHNKPVGLKEILASREVMQRLPVLCQDDGEDLSQFIHSTLLSPKHNQSSRACVLILFTSPVFLENTTPEQLDAYLDSQQRHIKFVSSLVEYPKLCKDEQTCYETLSSHFANQLDFRKYMREQIQNKDCTEERKNAFHNILQQRGMEKFYPQYSIFYQGANMLGLQSDMRKVIGRFFADVSFYSEDTDTFENRQRKTS